MKKPASKIPAGKVQACADTNAPDSSNKQAETAEARMARFGFPVPEIETAEWLAKQGWERISFVFESEREAKGDYRESEILADPSGQLWIVTDWHGESGIPLRAERRRITREAAVARIARFMIPEEFRGAFRECQPPKLRLETAIQEARAFMLLMSDPPEEFCGQRGESIQAGIASLSLRIGDDLAAAFYAAEDAE